MKIREYYASVCKFALAAVALAGLTFLAPVAHAQATAGLMVVGPGETLVIGPGVERRHTGPIVVSGGRIEVNGGKLFLNGTMTIVQNGAVVFDAGEFHHEGEDTHVLVGGLQPSSGDGLLAVANVRFLRSKRPFFLGQFETVSCAISEVWIVFVQILTFKMDRFSGRGPFRMRFLVGTRCDLSFQTQPNVV